MIDFRYHLVSIVSVFLALAVGIVLGAGPLQGPITDTLTSELNQLRADKQALRNQVTDLDKAQTVSASYDQAMLGRVVSGLIAGRGVALVSLPGADADEVRTLADTVVAAGGTVSSTTRVLDSWVSTDAKTAAARADLADRLAPTLRVTVANGGGSAPTTPLASRVLAAALASTASSATAVGPESARAALTALVAAKLIDTDPAVATQAQLVIVVTAPVTGAGEDAKAQANAWVQLVGALDATALGTVATCSSGVDTSDHDTSIIRVLRKDSTVAKAVSTVDDIKTPMGVASTFLALANEEVGSTGHYGTDEGANSPFAPLPKS